MGEGDEVRFRYLIYILYVGIRLYNSLSGKRKVRDGSIF